MRKYTPVTVFIGIGQDARLKACATGTRMTPSLKDESVSSLVRDALTQYIQKLEELEDTTINYTVEGQAKLNAETRNIERALKA